MKKEILITLCCASLMLVTPFTTIAQENKVSSNLTEQPDIDGLIAQIRVVIDEILQRYGHIPMVKGLCNSIFNSLNLVGKILYCIFLYSIEIPLFLIIFFVYGIFGFIPPNIGGLWFIFAMLVDRYCPPTNPLNNLFSPLQSFYTLFEKKEITKTFNSCPCLYI